MVGRDLHRVAGKIGKAAKHISNWNIWNMVLLKVEGMFIGMVQWRMFMSLGKRVTLNLFEGRIFAVIDRIGKQRLVGIPYALVMVKNVGLLLVDREVGQQGDGKLVLERL